MCAFWKFKTALFTFCILCVDVEKREKESSLQNVREDMRQVSRECLCGCRNKLRSLERD